MGQSTWREDLAWAAGLFEGEGCVHVGVRKSGTHVLRLVLSMTDRDVVERMGQIMSVGRVYEVPKHATWQGHWKTQYRWVVDRADHIQAALAMFWPWLGDRRRAKAREALAAFRAGVGKGGRMSDRTRCPQGHPYDDTNTYTYLKRSGRQQRQCRMCSRIRAAEKRACLTNA
jgi:hypothetical protein